MPVICNGAKSVGKGVVRSVGGHVPSTRRWRDLHVPPFEKIVVYLLRAARTGFAESLLAAAVWPPEWGVIWKKHYGPRQAADVPAACLKSMVDARSPYSWTRWGRKEAELRDAAISSGVAPVARPVRGEV